MRGIPGLGGVVVAQAQAVVVPELSVAFTALRPVAAGPVIRARERNLIVSMGEEAPVCSDPAENCWHLNRRGHPVITAK